MLSLKHDHRRPLSTQINTFLFSQPFRSDSDLTVLPVASTCLYPCRQVAVVAQESHQLQRQPEDIPTLREKEERVRSVFRKVSLRYYKDSASSQRLARSGAAPTSWR